MDDQTPSQSASRDRLRIASSQPLSLVNHPSNSDPAEDPLAFGTPRPALTSIALCSEGDRIEATATLALHGRILSATTHGDASDRTAVVARTTLSALEPLLSCPAFIESAQIVDVGGRDVALCIVGLEPPNGASGPALSVLVGSAMVRGDYEDATARSVLSALNRRLSR